MPPSVLRPDVAQALDAHVEGLGFECVDVQLSLEGGRRILRIRIDRPAGAQVASVEDDASSKTLRGVTLDECAGVRRKLAPFLEDLDGLPAGYVLEVSSPGINRPLTKPEHFRRFRGERAKLRLREKLDGGQSVTGILGALTDDVLEVETTTGVKKIALSQIAKARLHRDLDQYLKADRDSSAS